MLITRSDITVAGSYTEEVKGAGQFLIAYEMGARKLQNPQGGLEQVEWRLECDGTKVILSSPTQSPLYMFSDEYISEIDFAFDQNMYPFFCYVSAGLTKYRWFNPVVPQYETVTLLNPAYSPRCTLDDKRSFDVSNSDVIFAYVDGLTGWLCYHIQRERYGNVHPFAFVGREMHIRNMGFTDQGRLQFTLDDLTPKVEPDVHKGLANYVRPVSIIGAYKT